MANITEPTTGNFQVRVVRRGIERSKLFSRSHYLNKEATLRAAQRYRDQLIATCKGKVKRRLNGKAITNKSTGVVGVSRAEKYDKRRGQFYVSYRVCWTTNQGKVTITTFSLGRADLISHEKEAEGFRLSKRMRSDWEEHADNNTIHLFKPANYVLEPSIQ